MTDEQEKNTDIGTTWKEKTYKKATGCGSIYCIIAYRNEEPDKIEHIRIVGDGKNECGASFLESLGDMLTFSIRRIRNQFEADSIVKNLRYHRCNRIRPNKNGIRSCSDAVGQVLNVVLGEKK